MLQDTTWVVVSQVIKAIQNLDVTFVMEFSLEVIQE
jgi:hypothetical protein